MILSDRIENLGKESCGLFIRLFCLFFVASKLIMHYMNLDFADIRGQNRDFLWSFVYFNDSKIHSTGCFSFSKNLPRFVITVPFKSLL